MAGDYQVKEVTVEANMPEKLNFHFAKEHGDICVDDVNQNIHSGFCPMQAV